MLEGVDLAFLSLTPTVAWVVEPNHSVSLISENLSDVGAMIGMVIETVEYEYQTHWYWIADISVGNQTDVFLRAHSKVYEVLLGVAVTCLRVRLHILWLLCGLFNAFFL